MAENGTPRRKPIARALSDHWPASSALVVSTALGLASASGAISLTNALAAALSSWAIAAASMTMLIRQRARRLSGSGEQTQLLDALKSQFGVAEHLGAFGTFTIDKFSGRMQWSSGAFRLFKADPKNPEPTLRDFARAIHPEDRQRWIAAHRRALKRGGEAVVEYRWQPEESEAIWVRSIARAESSKSGRIVRLAGVVQDVTGMHAMRRRLEDSEAKFRDLTSLSSDWVWETDPEHKWSFFSSSASSVLGPWINSMLGKHLWDLDAEQMAFDAPDWAAQKTLMAGRAPFGAFEYTLTAPQGKPRFVSLSGRPVFDAQGTFIGYRGVGRDITREKQQRLLLRIESEIASLMREQHEPERVVTEVLTRICASMGWIGGMSIAQIAKRGSLTARERAGDERFTRMVSHLPQELVPESGSPESQVWQQARPMWIEDFREHPGLAHRYRAQELGAKAAFLAPIVDEAGRTTSVLLCLSPATFSDDGFLMRFAEALSRNLSLFLQGKAAERRLRHQSLHDALTDLPNRLYLAHQLEQRLARQEAAAVLYIDLDRYKIINDTLGHAVGDQVLIEVAKRMRETIRPEDVACRIGGDEFIVLLTRLSDRSEIERIGRRVLAAIEKPFMLMNRAYFLSASIGVAISPNDASDAEHLIKCADSAMYRVKSEGRNDIRFFAGGMSDERTEQLALASELPLAMERGDVEFYYQPIVDIRQEKMIGLEALMRWHHPTRGVLLPERFLPIAEQSKLIREIGQWAIRRVLDDRLAMGLDQFPEAAVSVNVSPRQLSDEEFVSSLTAMLEERNFPGRLLRLELTESAFIENPERTAELIEALRALGVQIIIDNFGTGYASLSYLRNLPVDGLKIDRSFVRNLPVDRGNRAIIESITTLAARLGLQAMALGVETAADLRVLSEANCDVLQGALICDPMPLERAISYMQSQQRSEKLRFLRNTGT
jgi:diguanylate cyclase (GGDEF)-like protein/PAS domain S-box-containing protein